MYKCKHRWHFYFSRVFETNYTVESIFGVILISLGVSVNRLVVIPKLLRDTLFQ